METIQVNEQDTVTLQVKAQNVDLLKDLLELTWYHNDLVIIPYYDARYSIDNKNKTLTITNFTSTDSGLYKVQFDQLLVHPPSEVCKDRVLSLLRNDPILKPVTFCATTDRRCLDMQLGTQTREFFVVSLNSTLAGTLSSISLKASGTVLNSKELQYSTIEWYRSGVRITSSLSTLKKKYNNLSLTQELQIMNASYDDAGRYEALLRIDLFYYLRRNCQPYYDSFISPHIRIVYNGVMTIAKEYIDISYYKGILYIYFSNTYCQAIAHS